MTTSRPQIEPLEFDSKGMPIWKLVVPQTSGVSRTGHSIPHWLSFLPIARPREWSHSRLLLSLFIWGVVIPGYLGCFLLMWCMSGNRGIFAGRLSRCFYKIAFWFVTFHDGDKHEPVQAGMLFPNTLLPCPVDVGLVEPVVVLNAMGIPTEFCCEGHDKGYSIAYIAIETGIEFPPCLFQALDAHAVQYELLSWGEPSRQTLYAASPQDNAGFSAAMRAWARTKAAEVL